MITLHKSDDFQISTNFNVKEFYSKSPDVGQSHIFDSKFFPILQIIRDFVKVPIQINSTYRTLSENTLINGAATNSQHLYGRAVDFTCDKEQLNWIQEDFVSEGELFRTLRQKGVNGFGLYDTFIHIDSRVNGGVHVDAWGSYAMWDNRKKKVLI